ncbi:hypothetical protein [Nocardiopsis ganjiahuensis]|uniref:hypothetical protein n=1 Tax=Nocardiopsis ganjiahuensis TaxID=239984 RepID=UPI000345FE1C|nr:hypothetical protein [Nocardiopsis ganjiahuensis]
MPTPATHAPYRPRLSSVIGAAFVGSTLIAVMAPAHADPIASAEISFASSADTAQLGGEAVSNTLTVKNIGGLNICLIDLQTDASDFPAGAPTASLIAPGAPSTSAVSGSPTQDVTVVTATLEYAAAPADGVCADIDPESVQIARSGTWTVTATEPEPSPTPSETPTEEPSPSPTKTPSPSPTRPPSPSPTGTPTNTPSPSTPATEESTDGGSGGDTGGDSGGGSGGGSGDNRTPSNSTGGGSGNSRTPSNTPDRTPRSNVSSAPTSSADIPTLPRNEADLPDLAPGSAEDLADLPLVTPTSDEDAETEVAADHSDMGPSIAPAVLLAAFLLALLLATPLAPTRRVRIGSGYQGKRRKG